MRLLALTGKMGVGKSTAIRCVKELQHSGVALAKFAAPLYDMQEAIYSRVSPVYTRGRDFVKDRKLLQFLGTDWGRQVLGDSVWVDLWKKEVERLDDSLPGHIIVCDDVRFDNEAKMVKSLGGVIIQIESDQNEKRIDIGSGFPRHSSEDGIDLSYVDFIISNDGTVDDLKNALLTVNAEAHLW